MASLSAAPERDDVIFGESRRSRFRKMEDALACFFLCRTPEVPLTRINFLVSPAAVLFFSLALHRFLGRRGLVLAALTLAVLFVLFFLVDELLAEKE